MVKFNEHCYFQEVEEHSKEWHELRKQGIGGSDAGAILGLNQYKTNVDLWKEKTSEEPSEQITNDAIEFGSKSEEHIRAIYSLKNKVEVIKLEGTLISIKNPFMAINLDGYIPSDNGLIEIKTSSIKNYQMLLKWKDQVPDNYFTQCLHALAVTEADYIVLIALLYLDFREGDTVAEIREYRINRSEVEDQIEYLIKSEDKFWKQVQNKEMPLLKIIF